MMEGIVVSTRLSKVQQQQTKALGRQRNDEPTLFSCHLLHQ
jgi:hypothetical protein